MNNELIRTQDLVGPTISGMVSVPLAELDKMRSDHLKALNTAKELEARQALIKITFSKWETYADTVNDTHKDKYGNDVIYQRRSITKDRLIDKDTIFVNFDELRNPITEIEREKVAKEIEEFRKQVDYLIKLREEKNTKIADLEKKIAVATKSFDEQYKELRDLQTETKSKYENEVKLSEELSINVKDYKDRLDSLDKKLVETEELLQKVKGKKSFWYFIYSYFNKSNGAEIRNNN